MGMQYGMTYGTGSRYVGTSSRTYFNLASRWNDRAASLSATITSLRGSVDYTAGQLSKAREVKAKVDEAVRLQEAAEEELTKLGTDLAAATEIEGVQRRASSLGSYASDQVVKARADCQALVDGLQGELDRLNERLSAARESYDDAVSKARSYRASGNIAVSRERSARSGS